jgi:activator of HSP90 ATPase
VEIDRRAFAKALAASAAGISIPSGLLHPAASQARSGISHTADAIHQDAVLKATPARVYAVLTEAKLFDGVVKLSAAMKSMGLKEAPSTLSKEPGSAFALFGGYVTGRQIELVPNARIVQAWRAGSWKAGDYSIVTWTLAPADQGTKLSLDHGGFPAGEAVHLADGWKGNYFEPLVKYLAQSH